MVRNVSQDQRTVHLMAWRFVFRLNQDKHLQKSCYLLLVFSILCFQLPKTMNSLLILVSRVRICIRTYQQILLQGYKLLYMKTRHLGTSQFRFLAWQELFSGIGKEDMKKSQESHSSCYLIKKCRTSLYLFVPLL